MSAHTSYIYSAETKACAGLALAHNQREAEYRKTFSAKLRMLPVATETHPQTANAAKRIILCNVRELHFPHSVYMCILYDSHNKLRLFS